MNCLACRAFFRCGVGVVVGSVWLDHIRSLLIMDLTLRAADATCKAKPGIGNLKPLLTVQLAQSTCR